MVWKMWANTRLRPWLSTEKRWTASSGWGATLCLRWRSSRVLVSCSLADVGWSGRWRDCAALVCCGEDKKWNKNQNFQFISLFTFQPWNIFVKYGSQRFLWMYFFWRWVKWTNTNKTALRNHFVSHKWLFCFHIPFNHLNHGSPLSQYVNKY